MKNMIESIDTFFWLTARKIVQNLRRQIYLKSDRRPWRLGYIDNWFAFLRETIADQELMDCFRLARQLPAGYGYRMDGRVVEIPWLLSRLKNEETYFLDAGSSLNFKFILQSSMMCNKKVTIMTLAPEPTCFWSMGISYIYGDLRDTNFRDNFFEEIACISTIEHIGMDNSFYGGSSAVCVGSGLEFLRAVCELKRIVKKNGKVFFTFPFGRYENHGWFQQFDSNLADKLLDAFCPSAFVESVYQYDADGWKKSDRESCAHCQFFDVRKSKYFDRDSKIDFPPDYPAAERAVMCLELIK